MVCYELTAGRAYQPVMSVQLCEIYRDVTQAEVAKWLSQRPDDCFAAHASSAASACGGELAGHPAPVSAVYKWIHFRNCAVRFPRASALAMLSQERLPRCGTRPMASIHFDTCFRDISYVSNVFYMNVSKCFEMLSLFLHRRKAFAADSPSVALSDRL